MENTKRTANHTGLSSKEIAEIIVDALIDANFVDTDNFESAVDVVAVEINARKGMNDY